MSIFSYLSPPHNPSKMPEADKTPNPCGIKWQGPVLSGKRSLNQAMNEQPRVAATNNRQLKTGNRQPL